MKLKRLIYIALTTVTFIVVNTSILSTSATFQKSFFARTQAVAQMQADEELDIELEPIRQATVSYLSQGNPNSGTNPSIVRITARSGYALSTWTWGEAGGQTVLAQETDGWTVLSSGGGVVDVAALEALDIPTETATVLIEQDRASW